MKYPFLRGITRRKGLINAFYGYEDLHKVRGGAFRDMLNLSSDKFPLMSVRNARKRYFRALLGPGGSTQELRMAPDSPVTAAAAVNDTVVLCSQSSIYYKGNIVRNAPLVSSVDNRCIVPFGKNFFVVPDGRYVVTDGGGVSEVKHASFSQTLIGAYIDYVGADRNSVTFHVMSDFEPEEASTGLRWLDVSGESFVLREKTADGWETLVSVYIMVSCDGADAFAEAGDELSLTISGAVFKGLKVAGKGSGYVLLNGKAFSITPTDYLVTLKKTMPALDFAVEHENRIWGCRFGENENGEFVNEIYASALGDPTVWNRFGGISTDSYTVSLGCPGEFTGAAVTGGELVFFKEDYIIRVGGYTPQDFTVSVTPARGVKKGHSGSLTVLNEKLFYLSTAGVTVYDGALPYVVSEEFSTRLFSGTRAVSFNGKYYLAAENNGVGRIYVYDTKTGLWHIEDDDCGVRFFIPLDGTVFMLCKTNLDDAYYDLMVLDPECADAPRNLLGDGESGLVCRFDDLDPVSWYAETGDLGTDSGVNILRSLIFRIELGEGACFRVELKCGQFKKYVKLCEIKRTKKGVFSVPVVTPRCTSFSLRLSGEGDCVLHSIGLISEKAGEVYGFAI